MRTLKQSTAANVMVLMTDDADHITGKTGLTLTITASKDGAAFASITPTVTERGDGWYSLALTASHTDTLGELALHVTGVDADPTDKLCLVITVDLASSGGKVPATIAAGDIANDAITTLSIADGALTNAKIADGFLSVGKLQDSTISGAKLGTNSITAAKISTDAGEEIATAVWANSTRTLSSFGTLVADIATAVWAATTRLLTAGTNIVLAKGTGVTGFNDPSAADNADAVWDEALADHAGVGSAGEALSAAGSAGDPWATQLPGAYGAGSAGKIVGDNLDAPVSSRSTLAASEVNAEVVDALATDTYAEPGQGAPASDLSLVAKVGHMFKAWRNKTTQSATEYKLFADDGTTVDQKATVSDDGTTFTRSEIATGP